MRDLFCTNCSKLLIEDFWTMVEAEIVPTFASVSLICECGETVQIRRLRKPRWTRLSELRPLFAPG